MKVAHKEKAVDISKSENSLRLVIRAWIKPCRALYSKAGVYSVYDASDNRCLYVGKSTDLGKRCLRFFKPRTKVYSKPIGMMQAPKVNVQKNRFEAVAGEEIPTACFLNYEQQTVKLHKVYLEVTTISNIHWLDRFERTMIAIKKPFYNQLMNYNKEELNEG